MTRAPAPPRRRVAVAFVTALAAVAPVAAPAAGHEPPADALVAEIPFAPGTPPSRVMIDLAPEGHEPFVMMLDTGASASVITPRMARDMGVSIRRTKSSEYRRPTRLGRDLLFWVDTSSSDTGSRTGWEYGLLGATFLRHYVLEVDFAGRRVRFFDPDRYEVPESVAAEDEDVLELESGGTRLGVPLSVDGRRAHVLLDTGAPGTLLLSGRLARKLDLDLDAMEDYGHVHGVLGKTPALFHEVGELGIGKFRFAGVPIEVAPRGFYNQGGSNDSLVGFDVLSQFTIRIDYPEKRLWLKRRPDAGVRFYGADWRRAKEVGAHLVPVGDGRLEVAEVDAEGPATRLGLRAGDVVGSPESPASEEAALAAIEAGEALTVMRRRDDAWVDVVLGGGTRDDPR